MKQCRPRWPPVGWQLTKATAAAHDRRTHPAAQQAQDAITARNRRSTHARHAPRERHGCRAQQAHAGKKRCMESPHPPPAHACGCTSPSWTASRPSAAACWAGCWSWSWRAGAQAADGEGRQAFRLRRQPGAARQRRQASFRRSACCMHRPSHCHSARLKICQAPCPPPIHPSNTNHRILAAARPARLRGHRVHHRCGRCCQCGRLARRQRLVRLQRGGALEGGGTCKGDTSSGPACCNRLSARHAKRRACAHGAAHTATAMHCAACAAMQRAAHAAVHRAARAMHSAI